jgi:hypothetical protein
VLNIKYDLILLGNLEDETAVRQLSGRRIPGTGDLEQSF